MDTFTRLIGERIRLARETAGLSQEKLTHALRFNDRQTLSAIELGQRRVSPEELVRFSQILAQPLDFFTDPYRVAGAQPFSYRARQASAAELADFEEQAGRLIAAQRRFQELLGRPPSPVQPQITTLTPQATLDFATFQGERCAAAWQLGETPARQLRDAAAKRLGVVVLGIDAPRSISGAACRLPDGAYILINRGEPVGRQNFNLGHELFHILTWDRMPPARVDQVTTEGEPGGKRPKVEKLADAFTSGLLMPGATVEARWARRHQKPLAKWLVATARELGVSPVALFWRVVNLGLLEADAATRRSVEGLRGDGPEAHPVLYSEEFVRDLQAVLEQGAVTVRRVLELLEIDQPELEELFASYQLAVPFDL